MDAVDTGHKAFKFNKFNGVRDEIYREGFHFKIPYLERPVIFNVKSQPTKIESTTGSYGKSLFSHLSLDLQQVKIALRVLYRPD